MDQRRQAHYRGAALPPLLSSSFSPRCTCWGGRSLSGGWRGWWRGLQNGLSTATGGMTSEGLRPGPTPFSPSRRLEIDTSKAQAEAWPGVQTGLWMLGGSTHYLDYLKVEPKLSLAARVVGSRLCLAGMEFRQDI